MIFKKKTSWWETLFQPTVLGMECDPFLSRTWVAHHQSPDEIDLVSSSLSKAVISLFVKAKHKRLVE